MPAQYSARAVKIAAWLQTKEKNGTVPFGTFSEAARIFGVSRERVRQIAETSLIRSALATKCKVLCASCEKKDAVVGDFCNECYVIPIVCDHCGTAKRIKQSTILWRVSKKGQTHFYCSNPCRVDALRKDNK